MATNIAVSLFLLSALVLEEIAIDRDLEKEKLDEAQSLHLASLLLARYTGLKIYYTTLNQEKNVKSYFNFSRLPGTS